MITISTVTLYVTDQGRARDFYVDALGFDVRADQDMGPMGRWLEVTPAAGATAFVLADAATFEKAAVVGSSADVTLATDDLVGLHERLTAKGVAVTDVRRAEWGTYFQVTDPDGHVFVIKD